MILGRIHLIEFDELFDKMRLIVEAVMRNNVLPVDALAVGDLVRQKCEALDSCVVFR